VPAEIEEMSFLGEAYANNPLIKLRKLGVDLKKWAIEQAKSGWYPNINANGNYNYTSNRFDDMINPRHDNWNVGITGTVSIFDGMSTKAKVDEARARYSQEILSQENVVEQVARDIKQGCLNMREAHAIILAQKDNLQEAKEALRISYISYDNGVGINLDVIDSQTALGQVERNLASGIYDYLVAQAYLDRTMGREYFETIYKNNPTSEVDK
jgi:outer membrane protein TolC